MQTVSVPTTITVAVENGRNAITMNPGRLYVMHDVEVASGKQAGAFDRIETLPPRPRRFDPATALSGRMIVPFIGGLGDAVSLLPVLAGIRQDHPRLRIDVATTPGPAEVLSLTLAVERVVGYPLSLDEWQGYDHYLTLEVVYETAQTPGRALPEVFADALGVRLNGYDFALKLPRAVEAASQPSSVPLVGLAVGEGLSMRSYPQSMLRELIGLLVKRGLGCVLFGHTDPNWNIPVCPPIITDMRSRTPTVLELAVWLRAVDVVVCHDSFVMHLAGALGRPAVALFAPTSASHASPYASAARLRSTAECSPCHQAGASCPRGFDRCVAWDSDSLKPSAVADVVCERLSQQGRQLPATGGDIAIAL